VIAGRFAVRYPDHEETIAAGEAYYLPPGHVPDYLEDTEVFEVSPTAELSKVIEVVLGNLGPDGWSCPLPAASEPLPASLRRSAGVCASGSPVTAGGAVMVQVPGRGLTPPRG